jgi:hypothetical protein
VQLPNTTITSGAAADYGAGYISAGSGFTVNNTSSQSASVVFEAGTAICLGPGFTAVGGTAAVTFKAVIMTPTVPLAVTTSSLAWDAGYSSSGTLAATGGTPPRSGWAVSSGSLPAGLTLTAATGVISGTPTYAGTTTVGITVRDSLGGVSATQSVSIVVAPAVTVTTASLPNGTAGVGYSATLAASGGTPPYTWSVTSGALPAVLALSGGVISGIPSPTFAFLNDKRAPCGPPVP